MLNKNKIKKLKIQLEARQIIWRDISRMKSDPQESKNLSLEEETLKCWSKILKRAAKDYKKTLEELSLIEKRS